MSTMLTDFQNSLTELEQILVLIPNHIQYTVDRIGAGLFCRSALVHQYL